jgi:hypothetical protein
MSQFAGWRHWTREGTFEIVPIVLAASRFYELRFRDERLGTYSWIWTAAESVSKGDHDEAIGLKGSSLNVPTDPFEWNGFK